MNIIQAIILGLVQGLTEFIPVSSSGHLIVARHLLGVIKIGLAFDVALHMGTLGALVIYFRQDIPQFARSLFVKDEKTRIAWLLIAATVPAAIIGYFLEDAAESQFRSVRLVAVTMLLFGVIMLLVEKYYTRRSRHSSFENVSTRQALTMGFAQALALVPGVSRSGSTITAGLFAGLDRVSATRFSFLLGIPITAGAVVKVLSEDAALRQIQDERTIFLAGIVTALLSGLFAIRFLLGYLGKHGLSVFAYYRIGFGFIVLIISLAR